jgi:hypothetical protein
MVDTSNHESVKLVSVLVRYFIPRKGVQTKVIEFHSVKGEAADVLTSYIMYVLDKYKLPTKKLSFVGITVTQISEELQEREQCVSEPNDQRHKNEHSWHSMWCPHFASADILPVDIEAMVN